MRTTFTALALLVLVGAVIGHQPNESQLLKHLSKFTVVRDYSSSASQKAVDDARDYIKEEFDSYYLRIEEMKFNTTIAADILGNTRTVEGVNIIGIARGDNHDAGPFLVLAADYDSATKPLQNNGIGIAALIEVARQYYEQTGPFGNFDKNLTVIFVALDFNTKERILASSGISGGKHFVREWLVPYIGNDTSRFGGAIILDSIGNFNPNNETQLDVENFEEAFPDTYERVVNRGSKGDFVALITRNDSVSQNLKDNLTAAYYRDRKGRRFRLEDMTLGDNAPYGDILPLVEHHSQFHFWTNPDFPLPAILLTDTEEMRMDTYDCTIGCLAKNYLTPERQEFVDKTIDALVHTLLKLQTSRREQHSNSAVSVGSSAAATVLLALIARWIQ